MRLRVADHATPEAALRAALAALPPGPPVARCVIALAGPVGAGPVAMTNAPWVLDPTRLSEQLGGAPVTLLNDLEAMAWGLDALAAEGSELLAEGEAVRGAPRLVVAPGTGLGMAIALDGQVIATEAGHSAFAPGDATEDALLARLRASQGAVSNEDLLSGGGLPRLHAALAGDAGPARDAAAIARAALAGEPAALRSVHVFWAALGGFCGDAALMTGARGGVFLAGGVAQHLAPLLPREAFLARLRDKPPMRDYLARIPVRLITHPEPGLLGLARYAVRLSAPTGSPR